MTGFSTEGEDGTESEGGEPREHHPPELPLFFCGYPCTIYEKGCKVRYSLNRMTEETPHEGRPPFGTENKIFQDLHYYT